MKKIFLLFTVIFVQFALAQMPNISKVWLNNNNAYEGTIGNDKTSIRLKINISEQDKKNDQEYFVSGNSVVETNLSNFEGKIKITKYKDGKKRSVVYGDYEFLEEPKGKHSGKFTGKFVFTFNWNRKTQKIESQYIEFIGDWKSYDNSLNFKTGWKTK